MASVKAHEAERALKSLDRSIRVILFYGPDQGLVSERAEQTSRAAVSDPADPFQLVRMDGGDLAGDPMRLVDEANTIGLFGGQRAIRISSAARLPVAAIEPLLATPPVDSIIVIEGGDLARTNPVRTSVERSRTGLAVPCYGDEARGLEAVVDSVLAEAGMQIDRDARTLLLTRLGADRRLSRREVEKLAVYAHPSSTVTLADVDAVVGDASAKAVDDIVDSVFIGALPRLDNAFARLIASGEDPGTMLGFVARHAQMLLASRQVIDSGTESITGAVKAMRGLPFPRLKTVELSLQRWSTPALLRAIAALHQASAQVRLQPALGPELALRVLWNLAMSARG